MRFAGLGEVFPPKVFSWDCRKVDGRANGRVYLTLPFLPRCAVDDVHQTSRPNVTTSIMLNRCRITDALCRMECGNIIIQSQTIPPPGGGIEHIQCAAAIEYML